MNRLTYVSYCVVCGRRIGATKAKTCSEACRVALWNSGRRLFEVPHKLKCGVCGRMFTSKGFRRTCSEACNQKRRHENLRHVRRGSARQTKPPKLKPCRVTEAEKIALRRFSNSYGVGGDVPLPEPTNALPGTAEKIEVLRRRAKAGQSLFHPRDRMHWHVLLDAYGDSE